MTTRKLDELKSDPQTDPRLMTSEELDARIDRLQDAADRMKKTTERCKELVEKTAQEKAAGKS